MASAPDNHSFGKRRRRGRWQRFALFVAATSATPAAAQTSITGSSLALKSGGSASLGDTGYLGTYLVVPPGGATVKFTVNATAAAGASAAPHMNLAVADTVAGFSVSNTSATNYVTQNITLPAGAYVIRNERDYAQNVGVTRAFTVNSLSVSTVSGSAAVFSNTSSDANALSAANTYINNFRKGAAQVGLTGPGAVPLLPGTPVTADLTRHAFNFGGTASGVSAADPKSMLAVANPAAGTEAYKFQNFINTHFNTIVPSNAGKWASNESTRDVATMSYVDTILNYAQSHNMRARMHNLIWGSQQPSWVTNSSNTGLLNQAVDASLTQPQRDAARADLRQEITERIGYYVNATRANKYAELDVYNESYHTGANNSANPANYWNVYGAAGIAGIHNEIQQAVQAAGSSARIYTNEYNVFQWGDEYGNWYRQHIDDLRDAGGAVTGVGFQYYADPKLTGSNTHSAARMQKSLMGLSVEGLPLSLTEFGLSSALTADEANTLGPGVMDDSMRMMFGTPQATSFLIWGWWDLVGNPRPPAALLDNTPGTGNNDVLTPMGVRWEQLMSGWDTNVSTFVDANGAIGFTGFYGDYTLGGQAFALNLRKGTTQYIATLAAPPTWSIWKNATSGSWGGASNWQSGGVANAAGQTAYFGPASAGRAVTVDADRAVGMLAFDSANSYTLSAGGGTLTMQGFNNAAGHRAAIYVVAGSHTISAPLALADDTAITVAPAASTLTISNLRPTSANLTKAGAGTLALSNVRAGGLTVAAGVVRVLAGGSSGTASRLSTLSIASGARLDLADNKLVTDTPAGRFTAGAYTGVQGEVARAYNFGAWDQPGLTTSMPEAGPNAGILSGTTTIGIATASQVLFIEPTETGTFMGQTVTGATTIAMYTYAGDVNFDGLVDGADYGTLDNWIQFPGTDGYANGDVNYDGVIDGADYGVLDNTIQLQGAPIPTGSGSAMGEVAPVPEPSVCIVTLFATPLLTRIRRKTRCGIARRTNTST